MYDDFPNWFGKRLSNKNFLCYNIMFVIIIIFSKEKCEKKFSNSSKKILISSYNTEYRVNNP